MKYLVLLLVYFIVLGAAVLFRATLPRGWHGDAKRAVTLILLVFWAVWSVFCLAFGFLMFYGPDLNWNL